VKDFVYDVGVNNTTPPVTAGNVLGRLAKATAATSSVSFSYDAFGRANANVFTDRTVSSNNVYVQKFDYHGDGTLQTLHLLLPDNAFADEKVDYVYDSANRPRSITYSKSGAAQSLFAAAGTSSMYDAFGRLRSAAYGATTYSATYADTGRRLLTGATVSASGVPSRGISYLPVPGTSGAVTAFDPVGRERIRTETLAGIVQPTTVNDYDHIGRLAGTSTLSSGSLSGQRLFSYDSLGNLTLQQDMATSGHPPVAQLGYQTVDRDRLCTIAYGTASPPTACNVSYDGIGNIVSQPDQSNNVRTFSYFPGGQVATITRGATTATFDYDAFGAVQRLVIDAPGSDDDRHDKHFGGLLYQRDELVNGVKQTVLTRSIPGPDGLVATRHGAAASEPWTFSFGEARGTRFVVDQTGAPTQQVNYTPFGEASSTGAPAGSQLHQSAQWNGGDALSALGLVQVGARIYDPVLGRFLSRDPLLFAGAATASNPYAFASNDPINHSDPSGMGENPWDPLPGCVICDGPYQPPHRQPERPADPPRGGHPGHQDDKPKEPATSTATSSRTLSRHANPFASIASLWQTAVESTRPDPWDSNTIIHTANARDPLGRFDPTRRPVVIRGGSLFYVKKDQATFSPEYLAMVGMGLAMVGGPIAVDFLFTPVGAGVGGSAVAAEAARGGGDVEQGIAALESVAPGLESAAPALDNAAAAGPDRLVLVTSWASRGVTPDLASGRFVQLGEPTRWNFLKTGLPGGKLYFDGTFPWVTWAPSDVDVTNFISGLVPRSALSWPRGIEFWKGILGQRMLR
jgi:RHS repeat-associated protein